MITETPNLDAMTVEDLLNYDANESNNELLRMYAGHKADAIQQRLAGNIQAAIKCENVCDNIFRLLPPSLRW